MTVDAMIDVTTVVMTGVTIVVIDAMIVVMTGVTTAAITITIAAKSAAAIDVDVSVTFSSGRKKKLSHGGSFSIEIIEKVRGANFEYIRNGLDQYLFCLS
jgi:phage tail sheath gpL-like